MDSKQNMRSVFRENKLLYGAVRMFGLVAKWAQQTHVPNLLGVPGSRWHGLATPSRKPSALNCERGEAERGWGGTGRGQDSDVAHVPEGRRCLVRSRVGKVVIGTPLGRVPEGQLPPLAPPAVSAPFPQDSRGVGAPFSSQSSRVCFLWCLLCPHWGEPSLPPCHPTSHYSQATPCAPGFTALVSHLQTGVSVIAPGHPGQAADYLVRE